MKYVDNVYMYILFLNFIMLNFDKIKSFMWFIFGIEFHNSWNFQPKELKN